MMSISQILKLFIYLHLCLGCKFIYASIGNDIRKPYIVYMGELPEGRTTTMMMREHDHLLSETIGDERIARASKIHSYGRSFNGFVAKLLPHEAKTLSEKKGVVSVFPNKIQKLSTTRSWDFLGMPLRKTRRIPYIESNLIVGLLDTGVWPESPSFNDKGYGPAPHKWKGKCVKGVNFTGCNNKIIGAQYYNIDSGPVDVLTPLDIDGHGTHTASTVAGIPVKGASLYGIGKGTARGGVPMARIACYKVCWGIGCSDMDVLAGFDNAIADGVDLISVSIGGTPRHFFVDPIAIGSFHAMKHGVLTTCAAGNEGPDLLMVQNVAPWIMTVAASSIDRQFVADVELGNGVNITGISINTFSPEKQMYPLTSGALAANMSRGYGNASACDYGTLSQTKVEKKIVYCLGASGQDLTINEFHGSGMISSRDDDQYQADVAFPYLLPATVVSNKDGKRISQYINSAKGATAVIHKSRATTMAAPVVTSFSSRGPETMNLNILKPDITAPGLSILAAFTKYISVTGYDLYDKRRVLYNIESGTSMACPHVAGAAAYVKTFHPTWSAAAIKSALMTTATPMKIKTVGAELGSGSGQINPTRAVHPGLIYDINISSYIRFLCKHGYNSTTIRMLTGGKRMYECSSFKPTKGVDGLNYPSMHIQLNNTVSSFSAVFERIVTNVGYGKAVYTAKITSPEGLSIKVAPSSLSFDRSYQKRSFRVSVKGKFAGVNEYLLSGLLEWSDSKHHVRSPIVVYRSLT